MEVNAILIHPEDNVAVVIKISSNTELFRKMGDDIDLDAGPVLENKSIEEVGQDLIGFLQEVANGKLTKAEINRQEIVAIHTVGPAF